MCRCCRHLAARGYPITVVTPGNHRAEILRVVAALGRQFDQTVLLGYPPFLKDVVDAGIADGFAWRDQPIRLVLAGEVISEPWRDLMAERLGLADPARDTASLYGTADAGVLGNETRCRSRSGASSPVIIGLEQPAVRELVTGKFVMEVREDDDRNRALWIAVELSPAGAHAPPGPLGDAVAEAILASLLGLNSEFANYIPAARQRPRITLWPTGHPDYFPVGVKHRYSRPAPASR